MEYIPETKTIWGNIFQSQLIVEIDPITGKCLSIANLKSLYNPKESSLFKHFDLLNDVLNGIAYDPESQEKDRTSSSGPILLVTGKRWPRLYKIKLVKIPVKSQDKKLEEFGSLEDYYDYYHKTDSRVEFNM
ncbi:putative glutaminyl-peptide cyclotransferase [Cryptosporidium felis]|nr:putative glutaminyl-peptide cyclotransferase [Cryptosporidium felis]